MNLEGSGCLLESNFVASVYDCDDAGLNGKCSRFCDVDGRYLRSLSFRDGKVCLWETKSR